jgi:hypothetical protein
MRPIYQQMGLLPTRGMDLISDEPESAIWLSNDFSRKEKPQ